MKSLRRLAAYFRPYVRHLAFSGACMAVVGASAGAAAWLVKPVLDEVFIRTVGEERPALVQKRANPTRATILEADTLTGAGLFAFGQDSVVPCTRAFRRGLGDSAGSTHSTL